MKTKRPNFDPRLRGTWKSDRRATFRHYTPSSKVTPKRLERFKSLFGKLVIRWGQRFVYTEYNGSKFKDAYRVVASDSVSVVVRGYNEILNEERLTQIFFEKNRYWFWTPWGMREFFRRVK
jgi:hypothetical protein